MVVVVSMLTGFFTALLRSVFAVILVAFLISLVAVIGFVAYGASLFSVALTIIGFNGGLMLFAAAHIVGAGAKRA